MLKKIAAGEHRIDWREPKEIVGVVDAVKGREQYLDEGGDAEVVQTQLSILMLTPRFVFKFKRPINFGFADFSKLKQRHRYCRQEVRLNSRLARGVYLDVLPLRIKDGMYRFQPGGEVVDYAVVMRRLPREEMLDHRLLTGGVGVGEMEKLAGVLAGFHREAQSRHDRSESGSLELITRNWMDTFDQLLPYLNITISSDLHGRLQQSVFGFLQRNRGLFLQRINEGYIRNGHGDLRCEHIYMGEEIKIIGCMEFNDQLRFGDVASDLSVLLMDLAAAGHPELSRALLDRYVEATGDPGSVRLIPFYACYGALARGKVLSLKLSDKNLPNERQHALQTKAKRFFEMARQFAQEMKPPVVVLFAGLMGTGKSALAEVLAGQTGMVLLNSDRIRKNLAAQSPLWKNRKPGQKMPYDSGIYSPKWSELTYKSLFEEATRQIEKGCSVILDASFAKKERRDMAFDLARSLGAEPFMVECRLPEAEALRRLTLRQQTESSNSDGRPELYPIQKARFEPISEIEPARHLVMNTDLPVEMLLQQIFGNPWLTIPRQLFSEQIPVKAVS